MGLQLVDDCVNAPSTQVSRSNTFFVCLGTLPVPAGRIPEWRAMTFHLLSTARFSKKKWEMPGY